MDFIEKQYLGNPFLSFHLKSVRRGMGKEELSSLFFFSCLLHGGYFFKRVRSHAGSNAFYLSEMGFAKKGFQTGDLQLRSFFADIDLIFPLKGSRYRVSVPGISVD